MKKSHLYFLLYIFVLFLIESALIKIYSNSTALPQLLMLFGIVIAVKRPLTESIWVNFFAGLLLEFFSGQFFGAYVFAFVVNALIIFFVTRKIVTRETPFLTSILLVTIATVFFLLNIYVYSFILSNLGQGILLDFARLFWPGIFWTVLLNLVCFYLIKFLFNFLPKPDSSH